MIPDLRGALCDPPQDVPVTPGIYKVSRLRVRLRPYMQSHCGISRVGEAPAVIKVAKGFLDDLYREVSVRPRVSFPLTFRTSVKELMLSLVKGDGGCMHVFTVHGSPL